jgi:hypothetical protein
MGAAHHARRRQSSAPEHIHKQIDIIHTADARIVCYAAGAGVANPRFPSDWVVEMLDD